MNSKAKEYAIRYLKDTMKMDSATIAKELKIKESDVNAILNTNKTEVKDKSTSKDMMIHETSGKRSKNVSIMTQQASQYNDEVVKKIKYCH